MKPRVLIVMENIIVGEDIKNTLNRFGYEVLGVFKRIDDAIKISRELNPDVAVIDGDIEGRISGIEAGQIINQINIPVIFLNSYHHDKIAVDSKQNSSFAYISKPIDEKELYLKIREILG